MSERTKVTVPQLQQMKRDGQKIAKITAYDYPTGVWAERAPIDILLVGDFIAMTLWCDKRKRERHPQRSRLTVKRPLLGALA